jgi:hypothetical protein
MIRSGPIPCASKKTLDMDDADYGDDAVDLSDGGSELENEDGSAPASSYVTHKYTLLA